MDGLQRDTQLLRRMAEHYELTPAALAKRAKVAVTTINRPYSGTSTHRISQPTVDKLREAFPDYPGWGEYLASTGVSDRQISYRAQLGDQDDDMVEIAQIDLRYGLGAAFINEDAIESTPRRFSRGWLRSITDSPPALLFWTSGQGNSMSPTIEDGEIVLGDRSQSRPEYDDLIWACALGEMGTIKRLRVRADHVRLLADNQLVPDEIAHPDDNLRIVGRIIAVVKSL